MTLECWVVIPPPALQKAPPEVFMQLSVSGRTHTPLFFVFAVDSVPEVEDGRQLRVRYCPGLLRTGSMAATVILIYMDTSRATRAGQRPIRSQMRRERREERRSENLLKY